MAIYCDHPAAAKCTHTLQACAPYCKLAPENETKKSYSVLPVSCILNGDFMIAGGGRFWALLLSQEQKIYSQMQY